MDPNNNNYNNQGGAYGGNIPQMMKGSPGEGGGFFRSPEGVTYPMEYWWSHLEYELTPTGLPTPTSGEAIVQQYGPSSAPVAAPAQPFAAQPPAVTPKVTGYKAKRPPKLSLLRTTNKAEEEGPAMDVPPTPSSAFAGYGAPLGVSSQPSYTHPAPPVCAPSGPSMPAAGYTATAPVVIPKKAPAFRKKRPPPLMLAPQTNNNTDDFDESQCDQPTQSDWIALVPLQQALGAPPRASAPPPMLKMVMVPPAASSPPRRPLPSPASSPPRALNDPRYYEDRSG